MGSRGHRCWWSDIALWLQKEPRGSEDVLRVETCPRTVIRVWCCIFDALHFMGYSVMRTWWSVVCAEPWLTAYRLRLV